MNTASVMHTLSDRCACGAATSASDAGALAFMTTSVRYLLEAVEPICATCDRQGPDCDPTICEYLRTQIRSLCQNQNGTLPGSSVRPPQWDSPVAVLTE